MMVRNTDVCMYLSILGFKLAMVTLVACCNATALAAPAVNSNILDSYVFQQDLRAISELPKRLPSNERSYWLEDPEMRINPEFDNTNESIQSYRLRFKPTSNKERAARAAIGGLEYNQTKVSYNRALSKIYRSRYEQLLRLAEAEHVLSITSRELILDQVLLTAAQDMASDSNYDIASLQDAALRSSLRKSDLQVQQGIVEQLRATTVGRVLEISHAPGSYFALSDKLIAPQEIISNIELLETDAARNAPAVREAILARKHADAALALDKSTSGFGLNLMEVGYEQRNIDRYGITFGFRLPFARSTFRSNQRARKLIDAETNQELAFSIVRHQLANKKSLVNHLTASFNLHTDARQQFQEESQGLVADTNLPALRRYAIKLEQRQAKAHIDLLFAYLAYLDIAGALTSLPRRNWIRAI